MTKSNALYWRNRVAFHAYYGISQEDSATPDRPVDGSFELNDGVERYLVEVRCFDLGAED